MPKIAALETLKLYPNWVVRNRQKAPINPLTGEYAKSSDPTTWSTFDEAKSAHMRLNGASAGLGWMFQREIGIVGVDLDHCFDDDGNLTPFAESVVVRLASYTEYSPSGNGLHIWIRADIPKALKTDRIEVYGWGRYFTVTGKVFDGYNRIIESRHVEIMEIFQEHEPRPTMSGPAVERGPLTMWDNDDLEEVKRALSYIPSPSTYDVWLTCCMAVASKWNNADGVNAIVDWSSQGYKSKDPVTETTKKFESFKRTNGSLVGLGSLYHIASMYGYER